MRKNFMLSSAASLLLLASCGTESYQQIVTTESTTWSEAVTPQSEGAQNKTFSISLSDKGQTVDGFGGCFNELGWTSLSLLSEEDRQAVITELFAPNTGANFNICRMPVAANDFSTDWYSYNETEGDFAMENFSIDHDKNTLIPFIHSALALNPELQIWGSPWCPPSWFKYNKHYAARTEDHKIDPAYHNGLDPEKRGWEGTDMFIQEPEYLEAYALYFEKYIKAYREQGIDIFAVMPQNEFNSAQIFPSCLWTAKSLGNFIGEYLGPKMAALDVDVMVGTVERANTKLVDTMLLDPKCRQYVTAVGFQWAGKGAIGGIHESYPDMKLYQTEQECGDGKNDWKGAEYSWSLLKHYFDNGTSAYMYWNISLLEGGISRWGWAQNSLVVVDKADNSYRFTHEYYLMKHISHFVKPGARYISSPEDFDGLVFENPDGQIIVLYMDRSGEDTNLTLNINSKEYNVAASANSINTFVF
ncbi:MAG: glycoside hydrolase family 30 beta sandwich domain-containing protein [Rikenellaceae bacterium]